MVLKSLTNRRIGAIATVAYLALIISAFVVFSEKTLEVLLAQNGLPHSQIEDVDFGIDGTVLTNVHLPRLGITIAQMRLYATASDIGKVRLGKVAIKGVRWQRPDSVVDAPPATPFDLGSLRPVLAALNTYSTEIELEDITLTPAPNLPTITGKGTIYDRGDRYQLAASVATMPAADVVLPYDLTMTASADVFKSTGAIKAQADIQQLDITLPPALTAKRVAGWITFELPADVTAAPLIGAQITAGSLRVYDIPLTDSSLTVSGDDRALKAVISARLPETAGAKAGNGLQADLALTRNEGIDDLTAKVVATLDDLDTLGINGIAGSATVNADLAAQKDSAAAYSDIAAYRDIAGTVAIKARNLTIAKVFAKATGDLAGKLSFDPAGKKLSFASTAPLSLTAQRDGADWSLAMQTLALDYDIAAQNYQVALEQAALTSPYVALANGQADLDLSLTPNIVAAGKISGTVSTPHKPAYIVPLKFEATLASLSSRQHTTGLDLTLTGLSGALMVKAQGSHDSASNTGELRARLVPLEMQNGVRSLEEFFPITGEYVSNVTGSLGALARLQWSKDKNGWAVTQRGRLLLRDIGGNYNDFPIAGINTVISFDSLAPLTFERQQVAIGAFTAGLPLQNGLVTLSLDDKKQLVVHDGKMDMAGGKVGVSPFTFDLEKQQADIVLTADNLDLKQLFAIAPMEGLSAEGRMQGRLPIALRAGNTSLDQGALSSIGGGVIRYSPQQLPAFLADDTNQHIVDLRTALANFNFSSLKMGLQGDLLKEQTITLNIEGKNPDFYGGHPVKLNLNVEGPLQNIVRYAPGSASIPDAIQNQIEQFEDANATIAP